MSNGTKVLVLATCDSVFVFTINPKANYPYPSQVHFLQDKERLNSCKEIVLTDDESVAYIGSSTSSSYSLSICRVNSDNSLTMIGNYTNLGSLFYSYHDVNIDAYNNDSNIALTYQGNDTLAIYKINYF